MRIFILSLIVGCGMATAMQAEEILAPKSTWEYTFSDPTGDPTWNTTTGLGGIWASGPAPFGNTTNTSNGDFDRATEWLADGSDGDDLWVRKAVDLKGFDLTTVGWDLGVDNGFKLYANGVLIDSRNAEGFTSRWEYMGGFGGALHNGVNIIAAALEDHGGATAFDMQITGVPEPGTVGMLGLLMVGAVARRRRVA